jgi:NADH-quinone oxidoreductase subunit M
VAAVTALTFTWLSAVVGAVVIRCLPAGRPGLARWMALGVALAGAIASVAVFAGYDRSPGAPSLQMVTDLPWVPSLGIRFITGADGISAVLVLLAGIVAVAGVLFSWNIAHRVREFFALYLVVIGGVYGVFQSFDLFLMFVFYEVVIVPKYFLIAIWGSTDREYGAMKLTAYSVGGSALVLIGLVAIKAVAPTMALADLGLVEFEPWVQAWLFPVLFLGFGVLAGLWPFHTWAPTGHVAAPTAASMLLAGVVMKLGAYGAFRVAMVLFPAGMLQWRWAIAALAVAGIVYGAFAALAQRDLKFVIGYSSVNHMGFVLLGLATLDRIGLTGAVLQMFSHGIIAGLLFAVVGRMVYDRVHTRDLGRLGSFGLGRSLPFAAGVFVVASAASMGLPGFSGFVAELAVLIGVWNAFPGWLLLVAVGIVVTAGFTLRALQSTFFSGEPGAAAAAHDGEPLAPITAAERWGAWLLIGTSLWLGLYPGPVLDLIASALDGPMLERLMRVVEGVR